MSVGSCGSSANRGGMSSVGSSANRGGMDIIPVCLHVRLAKVRKQVHEGLHDLLMTLTRSL